MEVWNQFILMMLYIFIVAIYSLFFGNNILVGNEVNLKNFSNLYKVSDSHIHETLACFLQKTKRSFNNNLPWWQIKTKLKKQKENTNSQKHE